MMYTLKLAIGYLATFIGISVIIGLMFFAVISSIMGIIIFVTWSLPTAPINWLFGLRFSIAVGMLMAVLCSLSKEGQKMYRESSEDFWKLLQ